MNVRRIACSLAFAILAAPAAAFACTDGGPPNRICNDGGAEWIVCTDHAQCPEGQYCSAQGACGCGGRDAGVCDDSGCHGCEQWPVDGGTCSRPRFVCPDPTVADAAVDAGGGVVDDVGGGGVVDAGGGVVNDAGGGVVDAGGGIDGGGSIDVGVDAGGGDGGGGGCRVRAPGERAAGSPLALFAALMCVAALVRVRRR